MSYLFKYEITIIFYVINDSDVIINIINIKIFNEKKRVYIYQ